MNYKKRKFKSYVINLKSIKMFLFSLIIIILYFAVISNIDLSYVNIGLLRRCITNSISIANIEDANSNVLRVLDSRALILDALPYISSDKTTVTEKDIITIEDAPQIKTENSRITSNNLSIKNETNYTIDVQSILSEKPHFTLHKNKPLVLIVHTHASESFTSNGEFETSDTDRTLDTRYNMIRIGEEFAKILTDNGICVIHDKTIHDYPSYTSSYQRTLGTIEMYLEKYPSIEMVFDIHRDALIKEDGTKIKLTTEIDGKNVAQVMILCGTNESGLEFDGWEDNLRLAMQIQKTMEEDYPTLARPISISKNRYNMHKTRGSLLFEIGTNGNTLDEAINGAHYMAKALSKTIRNISK